MNEDLALEKLSKALEQKTKKELEEIQEIETQKLKDLSESLQESLEEELTTMQSDMTNRTTNLQNKLSLIRREILKEEKAFQKALQERKKKIVKEYGNLSENLTKIKMKQWIIPTIVGMSIVIGLGIGSLALGKWISNQYQEVSELSLKIENQKKELQRIEKAKGKYIKKAWSNAIGVKREPILYHSIEENLWIVQFEKSKGN